MPDGATGRSWTPRAGCTAGGPTRAELQDHLDKTIYADEMSSALYGINFPGGYHRTTQGSAGQTGGGNATVVTLDDGIDWSDRLLIIFIEGYNAANKLPGGAADSLSAPDYAMTVAMMYTDAGSTQAGATPPNAPRRSFWAADIHIFVDSADSNKLKIVNTAVATDYHYVVHVFATGKLS